jgi:hypothetical protein
MQGGVHRQRKAEMLGCREMEGAGESTGGGVDGAGVGASFATGRRAAVGDLEQGGAGGFDGGG